MNKSLRINKLMAAIVILASLIGCKADKKANQQQDGADNAAKPATEIQAGTSAPSSQADPDLEQLIEQQENDDPDSKSDGPMSVETIAQSYKAPSELKYFKQSNDFLFEKFYPIGWSKDGHFAYVVEPPDEASGLYFFKLVIRNMISDKDVYVWELDPDDEISEGSVKKMWNDNNIVFAQKLNEYKIIPEKDIKLLGTEFQAGDNKYKVTIENKMETDPDFGFEVVKTTNIYMKSPELGSKQVYSYTEHDFNLCLSRSVQGVIKSPYENRVAIFVRTEERGYEGPPNVIKTFLVGSDLERSFKK